MGAAVAYAVLGDWLNDGFTAATQETGAVPRVAGSWTAFNGARIEEATTNGASDPSFENGTLTNAYDNVNGVLSTANPRLGTRHLRCAATTAGGQWWVRGIPSQGIAASAGQTWTFSAYIYNRNAMSAGQEIRVVAIWVDGANAVISNPDAVTYLAITSQYVRISGSLVAPASTAKVNIGIATNGAATFDFDVDTLQVEQKSYATSYCDGSLGNGYAWTGTANASTSTRAASEVQLESAPLSATQGSVAVWYTAPFAAATGMTNLSFLEWGVDASNYLAARWNNTSLAWRLAIVSGGLTDAVELAGAHASGANLLLVYNWSASLLGISVNGGTLTTGARTQAVPNLSTKKVADVGASTVVGGTLGNQANGPITALAIFNRPLTQAEITYFSTLARPPVMGELAGTAMTALWLGKDTFYHNGGGDVLTSNVRQAGSQGARPLQWARGGDQARMLAPPKASGFLADLRNQDGTYNDGSNFVTGMSVKVLAVTPSGAYDLYRGLNQQPVIDPTHAVKAAHATALDDLSLLPGTKYSTPLLLNVTTDACFHALLDACGWDYRALVQRRAPALYLRLGEASGAMADISQSALSGTVTLGDGTRAVAGLLLHDPDPCMQFGGAATAGAKVQVADAAAIQNVFGGLGGSVLALVDALGAGGGGLGRVVDKTVWFLRVGNLVGTSLDLVFQRNFSTTNGVWTVPAALTLGRRYLVALTYVEGAVTNAPVVRLLDLTLGTLTTPAVTITTAPVGIATTDVGSALVVGNSSGQTATWNGYLDEVALWANYQLTSADVTAIGGARGRPGRALDVGKTTLTHWWMDEEDALQAVNALVYSEGPGAAVYLAGNGQFVFKNRQAVVQNARSTTSQTTFNDNVGAAPVHVGPVVPDPGLKDVVNSCEIVTKVRSTKSLTVVWTGPDASFVLAPNEVRRYVARGGDIFTEAVTPTGATVLASGSPTATSANTLTDTSAAFGSWAGYIVEVRDTSGNTQTKTIASNTATALTVNGNWVTQPDATYTYRVYAAPVSTTGKATAGGASTLTDSAAAWAVNVFATLSVAISSGTGAGQVRTIASNTATTLTTSSAWTVPPDTTSVYSVYGTSGSTGIDYGLNAGAVTVTLDRTSGATCTVTFTAGGGGATVTYPRLRAKYVSVDRTTSVRNQIDTSTSIRKYGARPFRLAVRAEMAVADAQNLCDGVATFYQNGLPTLRMPVVSLTSSELQQCLTREINDRVTVVDSDNGINADYLVRNLQHSLPAGDMALHHTYFGLEKAFAGRAFILDTSTLDGSDILWF